MKIELLEILNQIYLKRPEELFEYSRILVTAWLNYFFKVNKKKKCSKSRLKILYNCMSKTGYEQNMNKVEIWA